MDIKDLHKEEIDRLILLYISGDIDRESLALLRKWSEASADNALYVRDSLEIWFSAGAAGDKTSVARKEEAFRRFKARIAKEDAAGRAKRRFAMPASKWICRVAAAVLILLLPLAGYWGGMKKVEDNFSDIMVEAPMGARTKLYLPDGTLVWLNAGSRIVYSQGFGVSDRSLEMEGEGYFEVAKNEELPFEIKTKELNLCVLGTKFNFRNYADDEEAVVNLIEGRVRLRNELVVSGVLYMQPNERAVLTKHTGALVKSEVNVSNSTLWTRDELYFDEVLLKDIAKQLSRSFDVEIEVADSLQNRRFYGSFKIVGNSIDEILNTISSTGRMKYKCEGDRYVVY